LAQPHHQQRYQNHCGRFVLQMATNRISTWCLLVILVIFIWRRVSNHRGLQSQLHAALGKIAVLVQWYTIFSAGMVVFVLYSSIEYYAVYAFMSDSATESNLRKVYKESSENLNITFGEFKELLRVPMWIHAVNAISQLAGVAVVCIVVYQIWAFMIIPSYRAAQQNAVWKKHVWHPSKRVNWIVWILVLPTVFCIETMRANAKLWGVITGKAPEFNFFKFSEAQKLEFLYAREDLEIGSLMQFTAIWAFTRLVSSFFENTAIIKGHQDDAMAKLALEYKRLIRLGGFLGLWIYIAAGCLRAVVVIFLAVLLQFKLRNSNVDDPTILFIENVEESFENITASAFVLLTVVSVVNMFIMTRTFIITDKLGDVNKKIHWSAGHADLFRDSAESCGSLRSGDSAVHTALAGHELCALSAYQQSTGRDAKSGHSKYCLSRHCAHELLLLEGCGCRRRRSVGLS